MASVLGKRKAPSASTTKTSKPTATASSQTASPALKKKKSTEGLKKSATAAATATKKKTTTKKTKARKAEEEEDTSMLDAQEIFRRHFEAQFTPIEEKSAPKRKKSKAKAEEEEEEDSASGSDEEEDEGEEDIFEDEGADGEEGEGEEWSGLSGDEGSTEDDYDEDSDVSYDDIDENPVVEVVDHTKSNAPPVVSMSKRELKAFMSSKPPSQTDPSPTSLTAAQTPDDPDDENDKSMLANDLALQRLLSESHLLARHAVSPFSNPSNAASNSEGKLRQRQTDLRTQSLAGAQGVSGVKSIFVQEKMPMAMRKGIVASTAKREEKRRKTARENGIVLEREAPKKATKKESGGRFGQRGLDGLDVGRMRGAELRLSERDVRNIEGGGGGRGGGRGGPHDS
ncbi:uncharacterized protein BDZ83DRAFT_650012 [Colletotrichum acutatum]|uniref:Protein FAF1 n=1 Tax=Glomerella acutata TaxID=27357 RepID=A0AAD8XGC7_GLOAC|nr:uncharacterized protein BDZ83DRAFT_650012 [Colletotrichum acutatum]KAK1726929.1 hypothetical protein BDZ83DRAFT_650012 [Colletotrichum acutatum]